MICLLLIQRILFVVEIKLGLPAQISDILTTEPCQLCRCTTAAIASATAIAATAAAIATAAATVAAATAAAAAITAATAAAAAASATVTATTPTTAITAAVSATAAVDPVMLNTKGCLLVSGFGLELACSCILCLYLL